MLVGTKWIVLSCRTVNLGGTTGRLSASRPIWDGRFFVLQHVIGRAVIVRSKQHLHSPAWSETTPGAGVRQVQVSLPKWRIASSG